MAHVKSYISVLFTPDTKSSEKDTDLQWPTLHPILVFSLHQILTRVRRILIFTGPLYLAFYFHFTEILRLKKDSPL